MAFAIEVNKISEDKLFVYYNYCSAGLLVKNGKLRILKTNGHVEILELAETDKSGAQAERASWALMRHWKKGEYPEETYWAS